MNDKLLNVQDYNQTNGSENKSKVIQYEDFNIQHVNFKSQNFDENKFDPTDKILIPSKFLFYSTIIIYIGVLVGILDFIDRKNELGILGGYDSSTKSYNINLFFALIGAFGIFGMIIFIFCTLIYYTVLYTSSFNGKKDYCELLKYRKKNVSKLSSLIELLKKEVKDTNLDIYFKYEYNSGQIDSYSGAYLSSVYTEVKHLETGEEKFNCYNIKDISGLINIHSDPYKLIKINLEKYIIFSDELTVKHFNDDFEIFEKKYRNRPVNGVYSSSSGAKYRKEFCKPIKFDECFVLGNNVELPWYFNTYFSYLLSVLGFQYLHYLIVKKYLNCNIYTVRIVKVVSTNRNIKDFYADLKPQIALDDKIVYTIDDEDNYYMLADEPRVDDGSVSKEVLKDKYGKHIAKFLKE